MTMRGSTLSDYILVMLSNDASEFGLRFSKEF